MKPSFTRFKMQPYKLNIMLSIFRKIFSQLVANVILLIHQLFCCDMPLLITWPTDHLLSCRWRANTGQQWPNTHWISNGHVEDTHILLIQIRIQIFRNIYLLLTQHESRNGLDNAQSIYC